MTDSRWSVVERIFHEASERPSEERAAFVRTACGDDEHLRREVQSLLDQPSQAPFLEEPAIRVAVGMVDPQAASMAGDRIGVYQIGSLLGRGGMGEVYRARDTRLDRDVAIKVLPRAFTNDPDRLARFEREARVLASLNHPHIGMIHGLEESEGVLALVLEIVEGDTLADRIARGPIPVRQALTWARHIADALDAAHEKGIVHRDLKPANVKITPDELAKVLDFGLARTYGVEGQAVDPARSPTITSDGSVILGTAAYMSPEQARGQAVGKRGDVWAFGCVLYEMLTGRVAFDQPTVSDTLAAVLHHEPDWSALPAGLSPSVTTLLQRCLEKDVRQRRRDMGDVRAELEDALARPSGVTRTAVSGAASGRRWPRSMWPAAAGLIAGALIISAWWWGGGAPEPTHTLAARSQQITSVVGMEAMPAVSPKTPEVAFVLTVNGRRQIHRQFVAGGEPVPITSDDSDHDFPRWTPDSDAIVYFSPGKEGESGTLFEIASFGGTAARRIGPATTGADISHDGRLIAAFQQQDTGVVLAILQRDNLSATRVIPLPAAVEYETPRWSPADRSIAFVGNAGGSREYLYVVEVSAGEPRRIIEATDINGLAWLPGEDGLVYASSSGSTMRYPPIFNLRTVSLTGEGDRQLTVGAESHVHPDVSPSGQLLASRVRMDSEIYRFRVGGRPSTLDSAARITRQTAQVQTPSASADGLEIAYLSDSGGHSNVWVAPINGAGRPRRITNEHDPDLWVGLPLWSPAGDWIAYLKTKFGNTSLWIVRPDGSEEKQIVDGGTSAVWSSDGKAIYYQVYGPGKPTCVHRITIADRTAKEIRCDAAVPLVSRDERTLFFAPRAPAFANQIMKASPPGGEATRLPSYPASQMPMYPQGHALSPDDRLIAVPLREGVTTNIWVIPTGGGPKRRLTDFGDEAIFIGRQVSWSPDSRWVYAAIVKTDADIVLLDGLVRPAANSARR
jgi:Tol biopolymer transport system component